MNRVHLVRLPCRAGRPYRLSPSASPPVQRSAQAASAIIEGLARFGIDAAELGVHRLAEDEDLERLWHLAIKRTRRRTLPLEVGLGVPIGAMGMIDYLASSSPTIGDALAMAQRAFALVSPGSQLVIGEPRNGKRRVSVVNQPAFPGQIESDSLILGILLGRLRGIASQPLEIESVHLTEPEPASHEPWVRLLGVSRIRFGARRATLDFRARVWSVPVRSADPRLLATLKSMVEVDDQTPDALLVAVRLLAAQRLPSLLQLGQAAPALGTSCRSLQRKLAGSGTSVSAIVDDVRRELAEELMSIEHLTIGEVATRVGFAEPASFTRAWRRWFGVAPSSPRSP